MKYIVNSYVITLLLIFSSCAIGGQPIPIQENTLQIVDTNQSISIQPNTLVFSRLTSDGKEAAITNIRRYYGSLQDKIQQRTRELAQEQTKEQKDLDKIWNEASVRGTRVDSARSKMDSVWDILDGASKIRYLLGTLKEPNERLFNFMYDKCKASFGEEILQKILTTTAADNPELYLHAPFQIGALLPLIVNQYSEKATERDLHEFFMWSIQQRLQRHNNEITSATTFKIYGLNSDHQQVIYVLTVDEYRSLMAQFGSQRADIHIEFNQLQRHHRGW